MLDSLGFLETNLHVLMEKINDEILILIAIAAATILVFLLFIFVNNLNSRSKGKEYLTAITDQSGELRRQVNQLDLTPSPAPHVAFAQDLVTSAVAKGVPIAPLQTVLCNLVEAGVSDADIPGRLLAAADQLAELRTYLSNWRDNGPWLDEAGPEALACVDRGDFHAANEAIRLGREAGWTFPAAACREEAELYAMQAKLDRLQLRYCDAAGKYAAAAALVIDSGGADSCQFLIAQARELCDDGQEFGSRESLLHAVEVCHRALGVVSREQSPYDWAAAKHCLGTALFMIGMRDNEPPQLREAVEAYLAATEEWTRDRAPGDWAKAQNDLGEALQLLGGQESDLESLRRAAEAYRSALTQRSRDFAPTEWARIHKRLGDALAVLGIEEGDADRLIDAVNAYQEALDGVSRDLAPVDWAIGQNNLGNTLQALAGIEPGSGRLYQAVAAYQSVLQDRGIARSIFATANSNLGDALVAIGERENSSALLQEAASAYRAALEVRQADAAPLDIAKTHINLAYTLGALWNRTRNRQALDEALLAAESALQLSDGADGQEYIHAAELARQAILDAMGHPNAGAAAA
ncbi:MAG: hypothetical protein L0Y50_03300 [Beijerinckiaceae bacterium]|nr:hypothetical protein [Beijerinckiaceae bacterium]MCI0735291.1 hypothetical protein [Beijerinckiaceae bacterium]